MSSVTHHSLVTIIPVSRRCLTEALVAKVLNVRLVIAKTATAVSLETVASMHLIVPLHTEVRLFA